MPFNVEPLDEKEYLLDVDTEDLPGKKEPEADTDKSEDKKPNPQVKQEAKPTSKPAEETNKENEEDESNVLDTDSPFLEDEEDLEDDKVIKPKAQETDKGAEDKKQKPKKVDLKEGIDFSAYAQGLIDEGIWYPLQDKEGNVIPTDDLQLDQKSFAELAKQQADWKAEEALKERETEYGSQYQELVEHIKNKGNIQDLLQNYQEQKDIESLDANNPEQAEDILKMYAESTGLDEEDTKALIDSTKDRGADYLKSFAEKRKANLVSALQEERDNIKEQQSVQFTRQKQAQEAFDKKVKEFIYKTDKPDRDKKKLEKFFYDYKHPIDGGGKATDMYVKLQEFRSNPELWVKLGEFLENPDNYGVKSKIEDKTTSKLFNMFQSGKFNSKGTSQSPSRVKTNETEPARTPDTFKRIFKD